MSVKACEHDDVLLRCDVENTVREPPQQSASNVLMDNCEGEGVFLKGIEALLE